jgi:DNA (cytosine-5)-methyltransferase 1
MNAKNVTNINKLKYIELCAGIGGARAGIEECGWECAYAVDNDKDAVELHQKAFGNCYFEDVRKINPCEIPGHTILFAGFPCQPFSSMGHQKGFSHRSGNVFEAIIKIILYHNPRLIILENVVGILNNMRGHSMASILHLLNECGYTLTLHKF